MSELNHSTLRPHFFWWGLVSLALVLTLSALIPNEPGTALTRNTIRLSLAWYAAAIYFMLRLGPSDASAGYSSGWAAETHLGKCARWCWTWAAVIFSIHVALAFHYYHGWSHAHAFQHTFEVSGTGEGIYVSYLFQLLWTLDAAVWWLKPHAYAARPARIGRTLHAFMLFIVFNGMVVFESGPIRWAGVALFVALAGYWWKSRLRRQTTSASTTSASTTPATDAVAADAT